MPSPPANLTTLVSRLAATGAEFVLVGALAAVAQGAPLTTHDVDIVHRRSPENVDRLLAFLSSVNARYRGHPSHAPLAPRRDSLLGVGHKLFATDLGPLDVLGAIEGGRGYDDLVVRSISVEVAGYPVRVVGLETLIELERASTSAKDQLTLAILEATLDRSLKE